MATNIWAFTQKLSKQHTSESRKNVSCYSSKSCLVSPSAGNWTYDVVEPFDYEEFLLQYQILIEREPLRGILDFPPNDVDIKYIERPIRTLQPIIPEEKLDVLSPHVKACIRCYTSDWKIVKYQNRNYSSTIGPRVNLPLNLSVKQEFEDDYQGGPTESNSEVDIQSISSSERQSVISMGSSVSSCGDTLTPRNSWASLDLRHLAGDPLITEILEHFSPEILDQLNESRRQVERQESLFVLSPPNEDTEPIERRLPALPPSEHVGHRILVKCLQLTLELEVEPLFASMALYDAKERKKVSETFYFDLNPESLKRMLGDHIPYSDTSTLARACAFDVSYPSADLFIVIRLEKVLQGDINDCIEPYLKDDKNREKLKSNAVSVCERLGKYRQPFAWTAIYLMNIINGGNSLDRDEKDYCGTSNTNSLDRKTSSSGLEQLRKRASDMGTLTRRGSLERRSEKRRSWSPDHLANSLDNFRPITLTMSSFFKQEPEKMKDEDLYKCLLEFKKPNLIFKKLKCIPATLKLDISPMPVDTKNCLTPELMKLHPYMDDKCRPVKELLEFPVKEILTPHYVYRNLLFVNPKELNFSNRTGSARNLTVKVQLMAGEEIGNALNSIFGKSSCPEMANEAYTTVTYHNKCPSFYDEIKIKLPAALEDKHHLLFTFYHISCQKKLEQPTVDTPVGYTWLPLLRDGRLVSGEFSLPIMLDQLPANYSYIPPDVCLPSTRWLDNHKGLFTVVLDTTSSIHTQDPAIERFFSAYDYVYAGCIPSRLGESGVEAELRSSMIGLENAQPEAIIRNLTVILDSIIQLLVQPPKVSGHILNVRNTSFEALCLLLDKISNTVNLQKDSHGRDYLLATYIHYQCYLPHPLNEELNETSNLMRSSSNPDLEVSHYNSRTLDRASSMRATTNDEHSIYAIAYQRIVHQELISHWVIADTRTKELSMKNAWFLFELIVKSMIEHLNYTRSLNMARKIRFPEQFLDDIMTLLQSVISEIISYSMENNRKANKLNDALAFFIFDLFSICDRGFVMQLIRLYIKQTQSKISSIQDPSILITLKLEFVRIICSHEYYVPLNLPFATPFMSLSGASVSPSPSVTSSTSQNSFLSGAPASQERASTFAELTTEYRQHHYLTGLILTDLVAVLSEPCHSGLHQKAVDILRYLMYWHDTDPRYSSPDAKKRVAALYLPLLNIAMDVLPLMDVTDKNDKYLFEEGTLTSTKSHSVTITAINSEVTKTFLTCVLWLLKNIDQESLSQWLGELRAPRLAIMLQLLDACANCFEYKPHKRTQPAGYVQQQVVDVKSRLEDMILGQGSAREMMQKRKSNNQQNTEKLRWKKANRLGNDYVEKTKEDVLTDSHLEGMLATEASFIILDALERCVSTIAQWDSQQNLIGLALTVLLHALGKNQSITVLPHIFASQRSLVYKFHSALFDDESNHCAKLCLLLLKHCGSNLPSVRSQAAASLYLLMRQTFQIGNNFARVKMQVTMSLSKLVGTSSSFSDDSLRRSLKTILEYGERDNDLIDTSFPEQVRDLVFNLHMILSDTVKMKEFQDDPEMLLDLMYRIAKGYQNSPELRLTWLDSMAQKHKERGNFCEAGMCCLHSAALVAEYLAMLEPLPHLPDGAATLEKVSPNVLEESAVSDDVLSPDREEGCLGFSEGRLMKLLEQASGHLYAGAMYEPMNDIYSVLIPIAENNRDFKKLAYIHGKLHDAYTKIDQLHGKRLFGTYFRVGFYGLKFGDLDGEEFIYKEPNLTKLPEIFSRLENFYAERFGSENTVIIKDSNIVDISNLDPEKAYIQITYVEPYFEPHELRRRQTHFDKNYNIKRFMYATPFTTTGRAHGELHEQYKRKTILTTSVHFPYVKTRIQVVHRTQIILTPIEVAIEDIQKKTAELAAATLQEPADPKILQMVLQGCIGTTVNQGPLEMAMTFLPCDGKPLTLHQNKLRLCFKDFSKRCSDALKKNKNLIGSDQRDYQKELEKNYRQFTEKLQPLVNPQNLTIIPSSTSSSPSKYRNNESGSLRW
ncbi:dedicator of cytokinesis protein 7 [Onthophagus taurus]|uniref:dedicator of cytokinesis protein 7 n=1 Tax=Onthophagus taurus TaxID=166361 RepID=UPI000C20D0BF|nr:dedicator of cytokinesis protein 7 [Onthophagus taurus]